MLIPLVLNLLVHPTSAFTLSHPAIAQSALHAVEVAVLQPLQLETTYPGGIRLQVTGIEVKNRQVSLQLLVTNNSPIAIVLNSGLPGRGMVLQDDVGNIYTVVAPQNAPTIGVGAQQTLNRRFAFSGRLSPKAQKLTLTTNRGSGQTGQTPTVFPKIVVSDIPIPR